MTASGWAAGSKKIVEVVGRDDLGEVAGYALREGTGADLLRAHQRRNCDAGHETLVDVLSLPAVMIVTLSRVDIETP